MACEHVDSKNLQCYALCRCRGPVLRLHGLFGKYSGNVHRPAKKVKEGLGCCRALPRVFQQGYHPSTFFGYILVPAGHFDASPTLLLGVWDVPRYSRHRITKGIYEYYPYSRVWRSRYP